MKPTHLAPGTPVIVDDHDAAVVRQSFATGSTSYAFPHVRLSYPGGDQNDAVSFDRVELSGTGVGKVARVEVDSHKVDPWVGARRPRPSAIRR